jgi:FAD/FMN-containing dehydrogenase
MLGSWGRYPLARHVAEKPIVWRDEALPLHEQPLLAYGQGRSYGDCCLNDGGALLPTGALDRFISFENGVLRCEAGATLGEILELAVPRGWFLPVLPGTRHVSVGGAIANDIHGKNHHRAGTFGRHVRRFELLRSDRRVECAPGDELFAATIGGLGLTGLVTWAEIQLKPVPGPALRVEAVPFSGLDEFFALSDESDAKHEYTVAWLHVLRSRGIFFRGDHAEGKARPPRSKPGVPFDAPLVIDLTTEIFNEAYYAAQRLGRRSKLQHFEKYFFPLDGVARWNRLYGKQGFLQFQCVVPTREALAALLEQSPPSPLTVLKKFGELQSPGMLSFPRPGFTLSLDLPNRGADTYALYIRLERIAVEAGGAIYPAKDARMSPRSFARSFPRREEFEKHIDPAFSSSLWRRVAK